MSRSLKKNYDDGAFEETAENARYLTAKTALGTIGKTFIAVLNTGIKSAKSYVESGYNLSVLKSIAELKTDNLYDNLVKAEDRKHEMRLVNIRRKKASYPEFNNEAAYVGWLMAGKHKDALDKSLYKTFITEKQKEMESKQNELVKIQAEDNVIRKF